MPLATAFGSWRAAITVWGLLAAAAIVIWLPTLRQANKSKTTSQPATTTGTHAHAVVRVWRDRLAWAIAIYFAVLSMLFYTVSAWLPTLLTDRGASPSTGGTTLALVNIAAIPTALIVTILAHKRPSQIMLGIMGSGLLLVGLLALLLDPAHATWWGIVFGLGHGTATGVAYSLPLVRARDGAETAALGGMSQTIGYCLAAIGPTLAGILHDTTPHWGTILLLTLAALTLIQALAALTAGRANTWLRHHPTTHE